MCTPWPSFPDQGKRTNLLSRWAVLCANQRATPCVTTRKPLERKMPASRNFSEKRAVFLLSCKALCNHFYPPRYVCEAPNPSRNHPYRKVCLQSIFTQCLCPAPPFAAWLRQWTRGPRKRLPLGCAKASRTQRLKPRDYRALTIGSFPCFGRTRLSFHLVLRAPF